MTTKRRIRSMEGITGFTSEEFNFIIGWGLGVIVGAGLVAIMWWVS